MLNKNNIIKVIAVTIYFEVNILWISKFTASL